MSRTIVKICGLSTKEEVITADNGADYVGFVVGSPRSHRNISLERFEDLRPYVKNAQPVLVTVNCSIKFLHKLQQYEDVIIQLHGKARVFYQHIHRPAIGLNYSRDEIVKYAEYDPMNFLSVDSTDKLGYGGTGSTWQWQEIPPQKTTILVAGGINKHNFAEAMTVTGASGVDISSGVEIGGIKQPHLISEFIKMVREYR